MTDYPPKARWMIVAPIDISVPNACVLHLRGVVSSVLKRGHPVTLILKDGADPALLRSLFHFNNLTLQFYANPFPWNCLGSLWAIPLIIREIHKGACVLYSRMSLLSWIVMAFGRWFTSVTLITEHNGLVKDELKATLPNPLKLFSYLGQFAQWLDGMCAHYVRVVTPQMKEALIPQGLDTDKIIVASNGTDRDLFQPHDRNTSLEAYGLNPDLFYVGFIGSITAWQAIDDLIHGVSLIENDRIHIIIAGAGNALPEIKELVCRKGLEGRVHYLGQVDITQAATAISCFDIAVAPMRGALYNASGSAKIKIRDYAACGRCILAGNTEDHEILEQNDVMTTYAMDDIPDLARKIDALYRDDHRRTYTAQKALAHAEQYFGWDVVLDPLFKRVDAP